MYKLKLKQMRIASGLSQQETADKSGYSQSHVSKYERGRASPPASYLIDLAVLFKCDPADFFYPVQESTYRRLEAEKAPKLDLNGLSEGELSVARKITEKPAFLA